MEDILNNIHEVVVEKPVDLIIKQIKQLITSGQLKPGDRLPAERKLAEKFGLGRTYVRDAIKKLEFYGILKTLPQTGSIVAGLEISALEGLIADVLKLDNTDFYSLVETRFILETNAARLCARRRDENDLQSIKAALDMYSDKIKENPDNSVAYDEDLIFHRKIAEGSKNQALKSMMLTITPDIMSYYQKYKACKDTGQIALREHQLLYEYILQQDEDAACKTMELHLKGIMEFARKTKNVDLKEG